MESPPVRLRLVFDRTILSKTQKKEGLKRCWFLLKPQEHKTISELCSYLLASFCLHNAWPSGLLLSMEGFCLPSFESTSIFRDGDIVRVKRKETDTGMEMIGAENNVGSLLEPAEIVNQPPASGTGMKLLANEEFGKESGGYESESEQEQDRDASGKGLQEGALALSLTNSPEVTAAVSKKRKAFKELTGIRQKRKKRDSAQNGTAVKDVGNIAAREQKGNASPVKVDERHTKKHKPTTNMRKPSPQGNGSRNVDASDTPDETKKLPSRSARRKKAKRRWLRELKAKKEEPDQGQVLQQDDWESSEKNNRSAEKLHQDVPGKLSNGSDKPEKGTQHLDEDSETDDDVVPVVIKPGHIRFQSLRTASADQPVQKDEVSVETFHWNGTTSKKKGQKWGTEKAVYSKRGDHGSFNQDHSQALTTEQDKPKHEEIVFDELGFYATLPKVGDVIAYRLIELSTSWTPEISSYRVGKISEYDIESNRIVLTPVPQYPIPKKKIDEGESSVLAETSPYGEDYKEDGTLEVSYASLVEVRLVKSNHGEENSAQPVPCDVNEVLARGGEAGPSQKLENHSRPASSTRENGGLNMLEELQQMVELKKRELMQEGDQSKPENSRKSWSYRTLRGSAIGPTMALLRSETGK